MKRGKFGPPNGGLMNHQTAWQSRSRLAGWNYREPTGGLLMEREEVKARIADLLTELSPEDKKWVIETLQSENVIHREAPFNMLEEPHTVGMVICEEAVVCRIDV